MRYVAKMTKKASKGVERLPIRSVDILARLLCDIRDFGPIQPKYSHYGRIGDGCYHCHLGIHWVACWRVDEAEGFVEVFYVGSRESAPY